MQNRLAATLHSHNLHKSLQGSFKLNRQPSPLKQLLNYNRKVDLPYKLNASTMIKRGSSDSADRDRDCNYVENISSEAAFFCTV